jgi:predicted metal-dependent phosphoesterase TrpH
MPKLDERSIDLHAHTTASDGDQSPVQLVERAKEKGLAAIAVTDHDTTDGVTEAVEAGRRLGVEVVPGIELSAQIDHGQCHILGLNIDPHHDGLLSRLRDIQYKRINRNRLMVDKLNALPEFTGRGLHISMEELEQAAGGDIIARPHFARVMIQKGIVSSVQEAFDEYLAEGRPGNAQKEKVTPEEAIDLIHRAGGAAFLAHPNNLKRETPEETELYILRLKAEGMDGIEARYNLHTPEDNARYLELAARHGLLTSGGSDFHGPTVKPKVFLGDVENGSPAPYGLLTALREHKA